jgi:hypothetical protein
MLSMERTQPYPGMSGQTSRLILKTASEHYCSIERRRQLLRLVLAAGMDRFSRSHRFRLVPVFGRTCRNLDPHYAFIGAESEMGPIAEQSRS